MTEVVKRYVNYWAIIPAAGLGLRMGGMVPKQYLPLFGKTILEHTIEKFLNYSLIDKLVIVVNQNDQHWSRLSLSQQDQIITTEGGNQRAQSVLNGLRALEGLAEPDDWVMVHDAVRPCVRHQDLDRLIQKVEQHEVGGILGIPVIDTLKIVDNHGNIQRTLSREYAWRAQTPQMFRYQLLIDAMEKALADGIEITDESSAMEYIQLAPKMVYGSTFNIKITHPTDLAIAEKNLQEEQETCFV